MLLEDLAAEVIAFNLKRNFHPCSFEAKIEPSNPREQ